jgi:two-component system, OmpR family, phosphate regulon sensor histidine kinase PhoR
MNESAIRETEPRPSILVVDDEERIREGCRKVLAHDGFDVATADCGSQGLEMIEQRHYDVILLDLMMPSISGFDVLKRVKTVHPDSTIIVITGYATVEHSIEAMKHGAFDFIPKPFSPDQLRLLVSKAIEYTRALQDIASEKSRMRELINRLTDGVMATDRNKRVVLANPTFLRMVGFKGNSAINLSALDVVCDESLVTLMDQALAMPEEEFVELAEEWTPASRNGSGELLFSARCLPFRDRLGRNVGTITVLHDISAAKRLDQVRSDFVSMVAHEIRSPLNSILAQIQVVRDGLAGGLTEKQAEILGRASERIHGLVSLSSELLDLARIESGLILQEREQLDLGEILKDQWDFHHPRAEAAHISLELLPHGPLKRVLANRRNTEEVLSNLIGNAITYTPQGGRIELSATSENDTIRVSVKDTGFGIAPEDLQRIFAPFYRVKNEKTRMIVGTGLGLAIVKSIVEAHHGWVRVESIPDQGSTFHVFLPCAGV